MKSDKPILLVENDIVDVMTVKRSFKDLDIRNKLVVVGNGEDALEYLHDSTNENPCVILLDLNMPRMNGIEFLRLAKQDENIKRIPVVVMTTSNSEQDKLDSYNLGASGYMIKSIDYFQFLEIVKVIDRYWTVSELPPNGVNTYE